MIIERTDISDLKIDKVYLYDSLANRIVYEDFLEIEKEIEFNVKDNKSDKEMIQAAYYEYMLEENKAINEKAKDFSNCKIFYKQKPFYLISLKVPNKKDSLKFDNYKEMIESISEHNCEIKKIHSFDDPMSRLIGFACSCGKYWQVSLEGLKNADKEDRERASLNEGREKIAEELTNIINKNKEEKINNQLLLKKNICIFSKISIFCFNGDFKRFEFASE